MNRTILRVTATGVLILLVAACGGGSGSADEDMAADGDIAAPMTSVTPDEADPNAPEDAGAIIYEEEVPIPGTTLNACQVVTPMDVKSAFLATADVADGTFEANPTVLSPGRSECTYEGEFGRLIVQLTPEDGANLYDAAYGAYDGLEFIPGLGDGAFWSDKNHRGFVWQDRVTVMFTVFPASSDLTGMELTESLGAMMLEKL